MRFEWDEDKNRENIRKHGFDFNDAWQIFEGPLLEEQDRRRHYGEERWIGIGLLGDRIVVVTFTEPDDETIRIVSLRKGLRHERKRLEEKLNDRLGPDRSNDG